MDKKSSIRSLSYGHLSLLYLQLLWHCRGKECFNFLLPYYPTLNEYEKKMVDICKALVFYIDSFLNSS